jgi:RHS repeat-associated protein
VTQRFFAQGFQRLAPYSSLPASFYYTNDHLGSVREVLDATGSPRARYDYDAWGQRTKLSGDVDADFGFTGHLHHKPTGLILTHYRAYDPRLGRWLSRDPIAENGGINLYGYVGNDPVNWWDPFGLTPTSDVLQSLYEMNGGEGDFAEKVKEIGDSHTKDLANSALEATNTVASLIPGEGVGGRVVCEMAKKADIKFVEYLAKKTRT